MLTNVMNQPPMPKNAKLFGQGLDRQIGLNAILFAVVTLIAIWIGQKLTLGGLQPNEQVGQTMAFIILSLTSIWHVFNIRSEKTLFAISYGANKSLVNMAIIATLITLAISLVPLTQTLFGLTALSIAHWAVILVLSVLPTIVIELFKRMRPNLFKV